MSLTNRDAQNPSTRLEEDLASFAAQLQVALQPIHRQHSVDAIKFPGASGAFPADIVRPTFLVVADACCLRDDLLYACRQRQRTSLVTAANEGDLRLFCARHVVLEVVEHAPRWAHERKVALEDFLARWRDEYLPVIRIVDGEDELVAMLDPIERERIEQLRQVDPDDVASAALGMLLEAFYLSRDTRALRAAYGDRLDLDEHESWLEMLQAGSDAGQLARMGRAALALTGGLSTGAGVAVKRLVTATGPWIIISLVGLVSIAAARMSPERRRRSLDTVWAALQTLTDAHRARAHLLSRLRRATRTRPRGTAEPVKLGETDGARI